MSMSSDEAQQTLQTLERLICLAERLDMRSPTQRVALDALRGRRTILRQLLASRRQIEAQKVVFLSAWRDVDARSAAL